nr:uncharacterized protein FLJ40521-like [Procambarus clarkii]
MHRHRILQRHAEQQRGFVEFFQPVNQLCDAEVELYQQVVPEEVDGVRQATQQVLTADGVPLRQRLPRLQQAPVESPPHLGKGLLPQPGKYLLPQPGKYLLPQSGKCLLPQPGKYLLPQPGKCLLPQPGKYLLPQPGKCLLPQPGKYLLPQPGKYLLPQPGKRLGKRLPGPESVHHGHQKTKGEDLREEWRSPALNAPSRHLAPEVTCLPAPRPEAQQVSKVGHGAPVGGQDGVDEVTPDESSCHWHQFPYTPGRYLQQDPETPGCYLQHDPETPGCLLQQDPETPGCHLQQDPEAYQHLSEDGSEEGHQPPGL